MENHNDAADDEQTIAVQFEVDDLKKKVSRLTLENNRYHSWDVHSLAMCSCEDQVTTTPIKPSDERIFRSCTAS